MYKVYFNILIILITFSGCNVNIPEDILDFGKEYREECENKLPKCMSKRHDSYNAPSENFDPYAPDTTPYIRKFEHTYSFDAKNNCPGCCMIQFKMKYQDDGKDFTDNGSIVNCLDASDNDVSISDVEISGGSSKGDIRFNILIDSEKEMENIYCYLVDDENNKGPIECAGYCVYYSRYEIFSAEEDTTYDSRLQCQPTE